MAQLAFNELLLSCLHLLNTWVLGNGCDIRPESDGSDLSPKWYPGHAIATL
jgi:hypothetical protein